MLIVEVIKTSTINKYNIQLQYQKSIAISILDLKSKIITLQSKI